MSNKSINYTKRDFEAIKNELITFSKKYYPEISNDFNDASVGAWFIDLVSAVGDNLNYHIDRTYAENNINTATMKSSLLNNARKNGIKIPGPKASMCEVELTCTLPIDSVNISTPNFSIAPIIKMGSVVGNTDYRFELIEDVDFRTQFNKDGVSNRTFAPLRNNNGIITAYTVSKTTMVVGGTSKIYKKVLTNTDVKPFMEIVMPEKDILSIESIIFKESSNYKSEPQSYEYYITDEQFKVNNEQIKTYRYFEVDSLSDQFIFDSKVNYVKSDTVVPYNTEVYEDYTETVNDDNPSSSQRSTRYFRGEWKPITQKFITEYTDNGYLKLIFGCGTRPLKLDSNTTKYAKHMMTKIMNNDLLGELPKIGWTMYVLYKTGGGTVTNLAQGSINSVVNANAAFIGDVSDKDKTSIMNSLKVNNISPSVGGKDMPSAEEIKYLTKYTIPSQERCVTIKDYKARLLQIPAKFGCPFRLNGLEDNNKVIISCLGLNSNGKLDDGLPNLMVENMQEYLTHYKNLGDYVEFRSGKIYNLGFMVDVFVDKNYDTSVVVKNLIKFITEYMSVKNHDMGEDIFVGELEKEINNLDGVISLINLEVYALYGGNLYSEDVPSLPKSYVSFDGCTSSPVSFNVEGGKSFKIDLNSTDYVLYSDYDSMFEIKYPENDIKIKVKTR